MHSSVSILTLAALGAFALVAQAEEHTKDSLDTVKKAIAAKTAVLIDVREKQEWEQGHLRDAKLLPLSSLRRESLTAKELAELLPKGKAIYLHCAAGVRCLTAAEMLRKQGYDVRALKEGYKALLKEGFPKAE